MYYDNQQIDTKGNIAEWVQDNFQNPVFYIPVCMYKSSDIGVQLQLRSLFVGHEDGKVFKDPMDYGVWICGWIETINRKLPNKILNIIDNQINKYFGDRQLVISIEAVDPYNIQGRGGRLISINSRIFIIIT